MQELFDKLSTSLIIQIDTKFDTLSNNFEVKFLILQRLEDNNLGQFRTYVGTELTMTRERIDNLEQRIPDKNLIENITQRVEALELELALNNNKTLELERQLEDQVVFWRNM